MSNYSKTVNFAVKDALLTGDPAKVIKGAELDTEFNNIATASATKADAAGTVITSGTINGTQVGNSTPSSGAFTTLSAASLAITTAAGKIIPGATSLSHRNNADSADNVLITDAGNTTIRGSASWGTGTANFGTVIKRKSANQSVISNITPAPDNDLLFAIGANEEWEADLHIDFGNSIATTGIRLNVTCPAGCSISASAFVATDILGQSAYGNAASSGGQIMATTAFSGNTGQVRMNIWTLNGATPGNVVLQWSQNTNIATNLTFLKGSVLRAIRVA